MQIIAQLSQSNKKYIYYIDSNCLVILILYLLKKQKLFSGNKIIAYKNNIINL